MNKSITVAQIESAMRAAKRAGLFVKVQLIMGYPGETRQTVYETVNLFRRLNHPGRRFALILPLPGSELYEQCKKDGRIKDEDHYLTRIHRGYGGVMTFMNFMGMPDEQAVSLMREAERVMNNNYAWHLLKRLRLRELHEFAVTLRSDVGAIVYVVQMFSGLLRKLGLEELPKYAEIVES